MYCPKHFDELVSFAIKNHPDELRDHFNEPTHELDNEFGLRFLPLYNALVKEHSYWDVMTHPRIFDRDSILCKIYPTPWNYWLRKEPDLINFIYGPIKVCLVIDSSLFLTKPTQQEQGVLREVAPREVDSSFWCVDGWTLVHSKEWRQVG
jgi:hypothetical protein